MFKTDPFKKFAREMTRKMMAEMMFEFIPKPPSISCCGKPIVFPYPRKTYKCPLCGRKHRLVVRIEEIGRKKYTPR